MVVILSRGWKVRLATLLDLALLESEALAPLLEGDGSVAVDIALLEEGLDARLHGNDGGGDGDQLVVGHLLVVGLDVKVAELPDDGVDVLLLIISLGLIEKFLPLQLVQLATRLELLHDLEEPVGHAVGELGHELVGALVQLLALSEVLEVNLGVGGLGAGGVLLLAQASLAVEVAEGNEGGIVVTAHLHTRISVELGALGDALALRGSLLVDDAFLAPSAHVVLAGVLLGFLLLLLVILLLDVLKKGLELVDLDLLLHLLRLLGGVEKGQGCEAQH
ncbi:hypothetical protein PFISCL1PPCAC_17268, partial [Pristionchus fissidentatus]